MTRLLYLIGEPGSGKTTLAAALTAGLPFLIARAPFGHVVYLTDPPCAQLGASRGAFSGTDALSLSVQPKVVEWLAAGADGYQYLLAEGDRLANPSFLEAAAAHADVVVAHLAVPPAVAAERRRARAAQLGIHEQNETWLRGRATKVAGLAAHAQIVLDATLPTDQLAAELAAREPVAAMLRSQQ